MPLMQDDRAAENIPIERPICLTCSAVRLSVTRRATCRRRGGLAPPEALAALCTQGLDAFSSAPRCAVARKIRAAAELTAEERILVGGRTVGDTFGSDIRRVSRRHPLASDGPQAGLARGVVVPNLLTQLLWRACGEHYRRLHDRNRLPLPLGHGEGIRGLPVPRQVEESALIFFAEHLASRSSAGSCA